MYGKRVVHDKITYSQTGVWIVDTGTHSVYLIGEQRATEYRDWGIKGQGKSVLGNIGTG